MVGKEDPTLRIEIDEETGEHLMSGMGELHLEVTADKIKRDKHLEIKTSEPIVVYRESVASKAGPVEGKSPNRHNRFYFEVMPLESGVVEIIRSGEFSMNMPEIDRRNMLIEAGMSSDEAKKVVDVYATNMLVDMTKGVQYLRETIELIIDGFHDAVKNGSLAFELCQGVKVNLVDIKLHEDAVHRGPAQVIPAVRSAIRGGMLLADASLLEPYQNIQVNTPQDQMGGAIKEVQGRRGQIIDIDQEGDMSIIQGKAPVAELFGFAGDLRSATEGRALWSTEFEGFIQIPASLQKEVVTSIRKRKGLKAEMPKPSDYLES
jgi:elongation factor 2